MLTGLEDSRGNLTSFVCSFDFLRQENTACQRDATWINRHCRSPVETILLYCAKITSVLEWIQGCTEVGKAAKRTDRLTLSSLFVSNNKVARQLGNMSNDANWAAWVTLSLLCCSVRQRHSYMVICLLQPATDRPHNEITRLQTVRTCVLWALIWLKLPPNSRLADCMLMN